MVTLDEVSAEARRIEPADVKRLIFTVLAGVLYGVFWVLARTVRLLWAAAVWSFAAAKLGWRDGWKRADRR